MDIQGKGERPHKHVDTETICQLTRTSMLHSAILAAPGVLRLKPSDRNFYRSRSFSPPLNHLIALDEPFALLIDIPWMLCRIALPLFWGRFGLMIPRQVPLRIVFGAPISFGRKSGGSASDGNSSAGSNGGGGVSAGGLRDVSDEELKEAHAAYIVAVKKLFDDNKARFGYGDRELQIL